MSSNAVLRDVYQSSGGVDWLRFLPLALITLLVSLAMAWCLSELFDFGFYYPLVGPLLLAMPVLWTALVAVAVGRCRSRFIATVLGLFAATVMYLGYYDICLARLIGIRNALQPDLALDYLDWRMKTDQIRPAEIPAVPGQNRNEAPLNWTMFAIELSVVSAILVVSLRGRAGRAFCEECGRWTTRANMKVPAGASRQIVDMLQSGSLDRLHRTPLGAVQWTGNAEVAVEYCEGRSTNGAACPVFFSIRDQVKLVDRRLSLGERLGSYFQFAWNYKTVDALRQVELSQTEAAAIANSFAGLKRTLGRATDPLGRRVADLRPLVTPSVLSEGPVAMVEPVPEEFAGTILTRSHAIVQTVVGLLPLVLIFGGGYAGFTFAERVRDPLAGALTVGGLVVLLLSLLFYTTYLTTRYMRGISWLAFAHRPDCWLDIREPGLLFVDIIPRSNWAKGLMESADDIGFLQVDEEHKQLVFEGDKERYRIPVEAITACKIESYSSGTGHSRTFYFLVVVSANTTEGPWETWFWQRHPDFRPYGKKRRLTVAQKLESRIRAMMLPHRLSGAPLQAV
jgi:hypothetical protein